MPYKNPQKNKEYHRQYYHKWIILPHNKEKSRLAQRKYYYSHLKELRERKAYQRYEHEQTYQVRARRYHRAKIKVLKMYGGENPKCNCCSENKYEFLTIDHIKRTGHYPYKLGGENLYGFLVKQPIRKDLYQILCYNCNMGKRVSEDCPHKKSLFNTIEEWENWAKCKNIKTPDHLKKLWTKPHKYF